MGVDRESAVRKAEELVREGKIDLAIEEYLRLVEEQPGDVGAGNALGDLYVKTGNRAAAVQQFVQIGDTHRDSGFVPKAVAFYKKALKVDPGCDHALSQLAAIAMGQELYADATLYLNRLLQRRRDQSNEVGVVDCLVLLAGFPSATPEAKLAAARASAHHSSSDQTARLWIDAADSLERAGRAGEAVDPLMQAATLEPADTALRRRVALACVTTGQIDRVRAFLSFETAGDHPDLLLALAEYALAEGRDDDARRALQHVMAVAPERRTEAETMLAPLVRDHEPAATAAPPADAAVPAPDVEVPLDLDAPLDVAAAFGAGPMADEPEAAEPEAAELADVPADVPAAAAGEFEWSLLVGEAEAEAEAEPEPVLQQATAEEEFPLEASDDAVYVVPDVEPEIVEPAIVDEAIVDEPAVEEEVPVPVAAPAASQADLDSIAALTAAARNPSLQFQASAQLGRLLLRLGRVREGIEWLEKATQAATPVREQRLDLMYELADVLERAGERGRALDVFADLDFDAASYRDVPERMASLRRGLGEGRAT